MTRYNRIDEHFRQLGEDFFGKTAMDRITDEQLEQARIFSMKELGRRTIKDGLQPDGTLKEIFCNYIFGTFM